MATVADVLSLQGKIKGKDGPTDGPLDGVEVLAIYFSAHWCPPCRAFTPQLAEFYNKINIEKKRFEIVFDSLDRSTKDFDDYYKDMPWLTVAFEEDDARESLTQKYSVSGIPALVIINQKDGSVLNANGRDLVGSNQSGFPWI